MFIVDLYLILSYFVIFVLYYGSAFLVWSFNVDASVVL